MRRPSHWGFTLVELMIVVGIIMALAGLVFAVAWQARAKSKQAACISNLRQIAQAIRLYAADYDGLPPKDYTYPADSPAQRQPELVVATLEHYGAKRGIWFCPSDPEARGGTMKDRVQRWVTSYAYRGYITYVGDGGDATGHIEAPDILEMNATARRFYYWLVRDARSAVKLGGQAPDRSSWHGGGFLVAYVDGSVRWVPLLRDEDDRVPNPFVTGG